MFLHGGRFLDYRNCCLIGYDLSAAMMELLTFVADRGHRRVLIPWLRAMEGLREHWKFDPWTRSDLVRESSHLRTP
jgi:hypothetical protein